MESALYGIYTLVCTRNLTRSLRSLVRFLIGQQLVRKSRTLALSMKYSLSIFCDSPFSIRQYLPNNLTCDITYYI